MGVGKNLISLIRALYADNISAIMNFGTTTGWINLERSCRQGDPVSAYLFIIVMEILLNKLRKMGIGLTIGQLHLWSTAFADDLTMFLKSNQELRDALKVFKEFRAVTGLDINYTKSEVMELNYEYDTTIGIPKKGIGKDKWNPVLSRL